jgi:hypothetical protein
MDIDELLSKEKGWDIKDYILLEIEIPIMIIHYELISIILYLNMGNKE